MAQRRAIGQEGGAALFIFLILLILAALAYLVSTLTPQAMQARRARLTQEALAQAREALLGYALKFRDDQIAGGTPNLMYGYLPLPDLGSSRNNNADPNCHENGDPGQPPLEGCDAANFAGNALNVTVIGRLPWRTLGTGPLRDGQGECLWYAVSGSHQRIQRTSPMNWDTLGQLDLVIANGTAALAGALASAHDRPIAVIFSSGPPSSGQNRGALGGDDVSQCGGNYDVANYLDPATVGALGGVTNYFSGAANNAFGDTSTATKALATGGAIHKKDDGTLWANACPAGANCDLVANDNGLTLTGDTLFGALRKSSGFRTDLNSMLDRMVSCLRDRIAAGSGFTPAAIAGYSAPADKSAGRVPSDSCYDDTQVPLGYFSHYQEQLFVATPNSGNFTVTDTNNTPADASDDTVQSCPGALALAGQRGSGQSRSTTTEKNTPGNYLEADNLASFTMPGLAFSGPSQFNTVASGQAANQDIVRCIPSGGTFSPVESPTLTAEGFGQLASYDPATRTLTLGRQDVTTGMGATASALFGCAWTPDTHALGAGLRAYFQFRFKLLGSSVGNNGFIFAVTDAVNNVGTACGASGSHLGFSGNNTATPRLTLPKLGIEFDQGRNAGFSEGVSSPGRNDPCGASGCGGTVGYNSHAAIVYGGHETANATDGVTLPDDDDNVHGFPSAGSQAGNPRPAAKNPDDLNALPVPGIAFVNLRGQASELGDSYLYHVRVEVTPTRTVAGSAELSKTSLKTEVWIERDSVTSASQIAAMQNSTRSMAQLYPGYDPKLRDTAEIYDVGGAACGVGGTCPAAQACGTDNICYRQGLAAVRLGFTGSQLTQDQQVNITNYFVSWPQ